MSKDTSKKSDSSIIADLFSRDESIISCISDEYGRYLYKIAYNVLADDEDSEECVNDTYLKIWNSIPPDKPKNFKAYIAKIVRNIALNKYKEKSRNKRIPSECTLCLDEIEECIPDVSNVDKEYNDRRLKETIDIFVCALSNRQRYIFICRYYCKDSVEAIAKSLNISGSMVFHELSDIRKKLKNKLIEEDLWYEN